ncbi:MAG: class I SAM-dependent methyltransferase [Thermoleophilaceae bacterium]
MIDTVEELIPLPVGEVAVRRPRDAEALLSEEGFEHEEFLPYWAQLWASAVALADNVARRALHGEPVLELGCGLGLPSIAAALAGGRVLATDWSPEAVRATRNNAERNGASLEAEVMAWAAPDAVVERGPWRWVIAADVLYEPRNVDQLLELLPRLVDRKGRVLIADPGRAPAERFLEEARSRWHVRSTSTPHGALAAVHRLRRR